MGHLTKRGWGGKSTLIVDSDYQEFRDRCYESHTAQWRADVYRWSSGTLHTLATDIPVVGGRLVLDSSDPIRRQLTLQVGGDDEWVPTSSNSPLAPWGQVVHLFVRIDRRGSGWFPWLKVFEGPIRETIYEEPSLILTLECADRGSTLHEYLHTKRRGYGDRTLLQAVSQMTDAALPGAVYNIEASAAAADIDVETFVADAGQSRLEAANELAGKWGHELYFDWNGDGILRRDLTDEDDAAWDPSEAGPDIGDVTRPVVRFRDGQDGNLIGVTTSLSREGSVNGVAMNLTALRDHCTPDAPLHWNHVETAVGSVAWGDSVGRIPLVETKSVRRITTTLQDRQIQRAKKLLKRRRGMTKFLDIDALPTYWAEPDDRITISTHGVEESHYLQRIEFDLSGGPMRCRTRVLTTPSL